MLVSFIFFILVLLFSVNSLNCISLSKFVQVYSAPSLQEDEFDGMTLLAQW